MENHDVDMQGTENNEADLDDMKKRLKEMEDEAAALREMQAKVAKDMGSVQGDSFSFLFLVLLILNLEFLLIIFTLLVDSRLLDSATAAASQASKEEIDSRSVFVGNTWFDLSLISYLSKLSHCITEPNLDIIKVDYSCTPEEVQQHFQSCGTVNRITIRTDKFGQPKGYAYVEFLEAEAVQEALLLNESELHGRQLKRTNLPGMKQHRPRRSNPYMGFHGRIPYAPPFAYSPYGYGKFPRFRAPMRYTPYY
ncbi:polyadenylate-binding protein 2-like isoform X1 [Senna tora]|uniref:Polyadenylate-binding protein 2-like isoform X1 n=1 Tax=Senna tora TaxID=362788 RepID=A0A834XEN3_9FABA|nr:polyadenylate-binding protein 2-like isoform X1 [Senna tora]